MALTTDEVLAKLYEARDNLVNIKIQITTNPKPSYNIDGQEVKWGEYLKQIDDALMRTNAAINDAEGPFEEETVAYSGP